MQQSRRDFCFALSAVLAYSQGLFAEGKTLPSRVYDFDNLAARTAGNVTLREILEGPIFEGCHISLHESDLAPHSRPHPPQRIATKKWGPANGLGFFRREDEPYPINYGIAAAIETADSPLSVLLVSTAVTA